MLKILILFILILNIISYSNALKCRKDGELLPDPTDCRYYYECKHGFPNIYECKNNMYFNTKSKKCDKPEKSGCVQH